MARMIPRGQDWRQRTSSPQSPAAALILMGRVLLPRFVGVFLVSVGVSFTEMSLTGKDFSETVSFDLGFFGHNSAPLGVICGVFGVFSLFVGILFIVRHFYFRRHMAESKMLQSSTVLALTVAIEFLIGAWLVVMGIGNIGAAFGSGGMSYTLVTITAVGLLLVTDSILLYRKFSRYEVGEKQGA